MPKTFSGRCAKRFRTWSLRSLRRAIRLTVCVGRLHLRPVICDVVPESGNLGHPPLLSGAIIGTASYQSDDQSTSIPSVMHLAVTDPEPSFSWPRP